MLGLLKFTLLVRTESQQLSHKHKSQLTFSTRGKRLAAAEARGIVKEKGFEKGKTLRKGALPSFLWSFSFFPCRKARFLYNLLPESYYRNIIKPASRQCYALNEPDCLAALLAWIHTLSEVIIFSVISESIIYFLPITAALLFLP